MKNRLARRIAFSAIMVALAMIMSYIELLIPFYGNAFGIKLGLANIIILTALFVLNTKYAFVISTIRVILISILFGNVYSFAFSMAGAILSIIIMSLLKLMKSFSIIGISIAGAVFHNLGQISVAVIVLGKGMIYYLPVLLVSGIVTGLIIGISGGIVVKRTKKHLKHMFEYDTI